jgi:Na+-translocating ferredoxin:NAD+ oxidoreductase RnfE subunit
MLRLDNEVSNGRGKAVSVGSGLEDAVLVRDGVVVGCGSSVVLLLMGTRVVVVGTGREMGAVVDLGGSPVCSSPSSSLSPYRPCLLSSASRFRLFVS